MDDDDDKDGIAAVKASLGRNYVEPFADMGGAINKGYSLAIHRPLSTLLQTSGSSLVGGVPVQLWNAVEDLANGEKKPELKEAWRTSAKLSPGQASQVNLNRVTNAGPRDFKTAHTYGAGGENYDPWFSTQTGTQDFFVSWFADPGVLAGKAVGAARRAGQTLRPGDIQKVADPAATGLNNRQQKLQSRFQGLMNATRDKNQAELYQMAIFRESSAGDVLSSLIARANKEPDAALRDEKVRSVLRVGLGDKAHIDELRAAGDSLADDMDNLHQNLDWLKTMTGPAGADMITAKIAQVEDEITRRSSYLDELDRLQKAEFRLGNQLGPSASGDLLDGVRLTRLRKDKILQDGPGSTPVYAMRWASGYRPAGWVKLHDGQNVTKNVERMLERVKGLDSETRMKWLGQVIDANSDAARQVAIYNIERQVFHHVAKQVGGDLDDDAIKAIYKTYGNKRHAVLSKWQNKAFTGAEQVAEDGTKRRLDLHFDEDSGTFVARPLLDTQLDNEMPLIDVDHIYKALKQNSHGSRGMKIVDEAGDLTVEAMSLYTNTWKIGALMRLGYMLRTTADPQLRMMAVLGAGTYAATVGAGTKNLAKNKLGRITVADVDDMAARVKAQARLDELEINLRGSQVVDEAGKPVRVYHGTNAGFDDFDDTKIDGLGWYGNGHYFSTDPEYASTYARGKGKLVDDETPRVVMAYLNIKKPADYDDSTLIPRAEAERMARSLGLDVDLALNRNTVGTGDLSKKSSFSPEELDTAFKVAHPSMMEEVASGRLKFATDQRRFNVLIREYLESRGYDGIKHIERVAGEHAEKGFRRDLYKTGAPSYVAFSKDQIHKPYRPEDDIEELRARLAEPAKTQTRRRTKAERVHMGQGEMKAGKYVVPDAHPADAEGFDFSMMQIDSRDSMRALMTDAEGSLRKTLRQSGNFDVVKPDSPAYQEGWTRAVNHQIRQSKLSELVIGGADDAALKKWLRNEEEGRAYSRRMRAVYHGDIDEMIGRTRAMVDHALAGNDELYLLARERNLTIDDLRTAIPDDSQWPEINGAVLEETYNTSKLSAFSEMFTERFYKIMSDVPETVMGRHPMYVQLYRKRVRDMVANADPRGDGVLTADDIARLSQASKEWARNEMKRTLFNIDAKSNLAHKLRFVMPFFSAWEDSTHKFGRIVMAHPETAPRAAMLWHAPEQAHLTVDQDGNLVQGGSGLKDSHFVILPSVPGLKQLSSVAQWRMSKSSVNIVLQGDPWWVPGWGGLVGFSANEIAKRKPDLADEFDKAGILPFGVQESSIDQATPEPRWMRRLRTAFSPDDDDYKETFAYIYATEAMKINTGERKKPKTEEALLDEVASRTRNWYIARAAATGLLPMAVSPQGDKQFYFDEAHRMREKYGRDWQKKFYEEYPEYFEAAVSLSKSTTGVQPTQEGWVASKKYKDLIARDPRFGWFIVGPEGEGEYSQAVRAAQFDQRVGPGSSKMHREQKDPRDAIVEVQAGKGWIEYTAMMGRLDAELEKRGLTSYRVAEAADMAEFKRGFIAHLGEKHPAWREDFNDSRGSKVEAFLRYASDVSKDKRLKGRGDMQAMTEYLDMRKLIQATLDQRAAQGGNKGLSAETNTDVAEFWAGYGQYLKSRYVTFGDTYDRMLESDDLSVRL